MLEIEHDNPAEADYGWPRLINLLIGVWLFASTFVWPHAPHARSVALYVGLLIALVSAWAMFVHAVHWINAVLAVGLFVLTLGHEHSALTAWNHVIISIIVFALALVPAGWQLVRRTGRHAAGS